MILAMQVTNPCFPRAFRFVSGSYGYVKYKKYKK